MDASSTRESVTHEVELKLEIDSGDIDLLREHGLLRDPPPKTQDQTTVYYDTPSGVVRKECYSLRVRSSGGKFVQTLKPVTDSAGLIARSETDWPVASLGPDLSALKRGPLGGHKLDGLAPIIRSDVTRTSWTVDVGGSRIQVDLDQGKIKAGERSQSFNELEFELLSGEPSCLFAAARVIGEWVPLRIGVLSKAERGAILAKGGFKKATKAAPVEIDRSMSVAEAFEVMVHACLRHYRMNEPLVIERRKAEALHQTRVAMRRLRSAFTLFKSAIADVEYQFLREELRWFTGELGDARNLDVYLERDLPEGDREALIHRREQAYEQVIAAMNSRRFRSLMIELVGWTAFGPWRSGKQARKPVESYAERRLDRLWHSIVHVGHHIADLDEHTRHRLRIQVKKMRYAIEFLRGLYPQHRIAEKRFADAVEELQESLGKLNDLATAKAFVAAPGKDDDWLIGEPEERLHLRDAERAFRDLHETGPFWRDHQHAAVVPA